MHWAVKRDQHTGEEYMAVSETGRPVLLDPLSNKGTAFTASEREALDLHGRLPPAVCTIEQQLDRTYESFSAKSSNLEKFIYLASLHDRNETLFFRLVHSHIDEMLPIIYTPTVGEACQKFSHIYRRARGLYIGYDRRGHIEEVLRSYGRPPAIVVVTDGERILGLGDLGSGGMGIPIGKLCLYTLCAGIPPEVTLPITLDVGTENREKLADPLYLGLRHPRVRDAPYQAFVDEFVDAVIRVFPRAVLQWEDFLKANAMRQLERFRDRLTTFNDDIQGTAGVLLAGVLSGMRITGQRLHEQRVVLAGAGAAAIGIAELLHSALCEDGLTTREARERIWMVDSRGLVVEDRPGLEEFKAPFARVRDEVAEFARHGSTGPTLEETVVHIVPTILVGCSGQPGVFTERMIKAMAAKHRRPMVFPLSNPTSQSECTAEEAIRWSAGTAIVATGSPFAPVDYDHRRYRIGQANNAFVFPGVGLGLWASGATRVTDGMFLDAAKALAAQVGQSDLAESAIYPPLVRLRDCSHAVACAVVRRAVRDGQVPEAMLQDLEERVARKMWSPCYRPIRYEPDVR